MVAKEYMGHASLSSTMCYIDTAEDEIKKLLVNNGDLLIDQTEDQDFSLLPAKRNARKVIKDITNIVTTPAPEMFRARRHLNR